MLVNILKFIPFLYGVLSLSISIAQTGQADSLLNQLQKAGNDSSRMNILNQLSQSFAGTSPEDAIKYATQAKALAESAGKICLS